MLLAVDVGNTQSVLGLFVDRELVAGGEFAADREAASAAELVATWRISSNPGLTGDELRVKTAGLLTLSGFSWAEVDEVVLASVVPRLTHAWEDVAAAETAGAILVVGPGLKTGMPIRYDNPHEVGADRIVNGVAAYRAYGGPVIVVDFGTATTLDVISEDGAYLGGAIAPGLETSAEALFTKAARLSKVDLDPPERAIGTNTRASIQAGLLLGEVERVDGLVRRVWTELGREATVVATGGLAPTLAPLCQTVGHVDVDLTLKGLRLVRDLNR